jgi:vacuolar protein sorting-associated protein 13A/C
MASVFEMDVKCAAPVVVLPIPEGNEAWLLNLGELGVATPHAGSENDYDEYHVAVERVALRHFKELNECLTLARRCEQLSSGVSVVKEVDVKLVAKVLRKREAKGPEVDVSA